MLEPVLRRVGASQVAEKMNSEGLLFNLVTGDPLYMLRLLFGRYAWQPALSLSRGGAEGGGGAGELFVMLVLEDGLWLSVAGP